MQQFSNEQECKQCRALLFDYVTELTDAAGSASVQEHLSRCDACRAEYEEICQMLSVLHEMPEPELPKGFGLSLHRSLVQAADEMQKKKETSFLGRLKKVGSMGGWKVAAPALVCFVLALSAYSGGVFEAWQNADNMLVMGEPTQAPRKELPAATEVPQAAATARPVVKTEKQPAVGSAPNTETTPEPVKKEPVAAAEPEETASFDAAQAEATGSGAAQAEATEASAQAEATEASAQAEATEASAQAEATDSSAAQAEATEASTQEHVPMMMSYRMAKQAAPVNYTLTVTGTPEAYLAACDEAIALALTERADFMEQTAILHVSVTEWETFSRYITTTDATLTPVTEPEEGADVVVEIQGYEG